MLALGALLAGLATVVVVVVVRDDSHSYRLVPRDTRAILRTKTLLGAYVELMQGEPSSGQLSEDAVLSQAEVAPTVELDEIFRSFDAPTRAAFQTWIQAQAAAAEGRGAELNAALGILPDVVEAPSGCSPSSTPSRVRPAGLCPRRARSSTRSASATAAARAGHGGQPPVQRDRRARRRAGRDLQGAAAVRCSSTSG